MKKKTLKFILYACLCCAWFSNAGCKKQDAFLNAKPSEALEIPSSLADLAALLHNEGTFNINDPALGEISSDDYYVLTADYNTLGTPMELNGYIFAKNVYPGSDVFDWDYPYQQVYYANTVLETLSKIGASSTQVNQYNQIKGIALFYRAIAFYNLVQTFAMPYDPKSASTDLGIPLRLSSDITLKVPRATVQACYDQILADLQAALPLLPTTAPVYVTEPAQPAINAQLARVYLALGNYNNAYKYADACLSKVNNLTDYNTLNPNSNAICGNFLNEDIFHSVLQSYFLLSTNSIAITDSVLYKSYADNDLRKSVFFVINNGLPYFRGTYDYQGYNFSGIATDEIFLIRAECSARLGNKDAAMTDLNTLLLARWKTGTFVPYNAVSADDALSQILKERRKELLFRGLRWTDLRRLNKDSRFAVTVTHSVNGKMYMLPPNDPLYALPIPDKEVQFNNIPQNPR